MMGHVANVGYSVYRDKIGIGPGSHSSTVDGRCMVKFRSVLLKLLIALIIGLDS